MGADLHAVDADQQEYLDEPLQFLSEHGRPPSVDVTLIRDNMGELGAGAELLYMDEMEPAAALALADSLDGSRDRGLDDPLDLRVEGVVHWLRVWAGANDSPVSGMH